MRKSDFEKRVDKAFQHYYDTVNLIDNLLKEKNNPQEIILLVCSRLDSLANLLKKNQQGQKSSFIHFLLNFSGDTKFFNRISIGDLYNYLYFFGGLSEDGLVQSPGRIRKFGKDSEDFLSFIEKSTIPITAKSVRQIAFRISRILEKNYRVKLGQSLSKRYTTSLGELSSAIRIVLLSILINRYS